MSFSISANLFAMDYRDRKDALKAALITACYNGDIHQTKLLIDQGVDVNTKDSYGDTILMFACESGNKDLVKLLIEKGANINAKNLSTSTALTWAIRSKHTDIAKLLIEKDAKC